MTLWDEIHHLALFKFKDYGVLSAEDDVVIEMLDQHLMSAVTDFSIVCLNDLSDKNKNERAFNVTLTDEEKQILAIGEAYHWASFLILNSDNLKNVLSTADFNFYSPANLLKELHSLRTSLAKEYKGKIIMYSYNHGNIVEMRE